MKKPVEETTRVFLCLFAPGASGYLAPGSLSSSWVVDPPERLARWPTLSIRHGPSISGFCSGQNEDAFGLRLWSKVKRHVSTALVPLGFTLAAFRAPLRLVFVGRRKPDDVGAIRSAIIAFNFDFFLDKLCRRAVEVSGL